MGLLTETIEHTEPDGTLYRLVISQASIFMATRRVRMISDARDEIEKAQTGEKPFTPEEAFLRISVYPNLTCCVMSGEGFEKWPIGFDEFSQRLSEPLWDRWAAAVRKLNPQWYDEVKPQDPKVSPNAEEPLTPSTSG